MLRGLSALVAHVITATIAHHPTLHMIKGYTPIHSTVLLTGIVVARNQNPNRSMNLIGKASVNDVGNILINLRREFTRFAPH